MGKWLKKKFMHPYNVTLYSHQKMKFLRILNDMVLSGSEL